MSRLIQLAKDSLSLILLCALVIVALAVTIVLLTPDLPPCPEGKERVGVDTVCRVSIPSITTRRP